MGDVVTLAAQRHFSTAEIAKMWGLSRDTVTKLFEHEPGVLVVSVPKRGRRRYRTFRIPESVLERVHRKLALAA